MKPGKRLVDAPRVPRRLQSLYGSLAATARNHEVKGDALLREVATELFCSLGTPVSLSCEILLRYGDLVQLVQKTISPDSYNDPEEFAIDYQAVSFLRKTPFKVEGLDPEGTAKKKFLEAELQCKETNKRIRAFVANPERASQTVRQAWCLAIGYIQEVLGTRVSSAEWIDSCRFGPGAFQHPLARGLTSVYDKLQVQPSVTPDLRSVGAKLVMSSPSWARSIRDIEDEGFHPFVDETHLVTFPGNRVEFVPKSATTERAIAVEPLVNIYAQLGVGRMMRKRLEAVAFIDLNEQFFNQELAREGSIRGFLCTIDLSSASDTVSRELVRYLLPEGWFSVMDLCRSKVGSLDGKWFCYEKFSSMGNGFTFELESLIFWALARAACVIAETPEMVSVFGDDIIVPSSAYQTLVEILEFCGFSLNKRKSFDKGVFRESCGKDYYDGIETRPFLQEEVPENLQQVLTLANGLRRAGHRRSHDPRGCDMRFRSAWLAATRAIPKSLRNCLKTPAHAGDSDGLISDWDEAQLSPFVFRASGWLEGWVCLRLAPVPKEEPHKAHHFEGGVASLLYRCKDGFGPDYSPADPRLGRDVKFELRYGAFHGAWTDLGSWM